MTQPRLRKPATRQSHSLLLAAVGLAAACNCRSAPTVTKEASHAGATRPEPSEEAAPDAPKADAPAPRLGLTLSSQGGGAGLALSLQNRDATALSLSTSIGVERARPDGSFEAIGEAAFLLRRDCAAPAAAPCVELVPGAELLPPALRALGPQGQCECPGCAPLPAGTYRVRVRGCDSGFSVASAEVTVSEGRRGLSPQLSVREGTQRESER